jgi:hypothetical protein
MIRSTVARTLGLAVAAASLQAGAARAQGLPPAQQVVEKYVQAVGGRDAMSRWTKRHLTGEVSVPAAGMTMTMESWYARPNRMLTKVEMQGMSMAQGVNNGVAWSNSPMQGARILSGDEAKQVLELQNFDNNFDLTKVFASMETVGDRTVDGRPCWNVKMVTAGGIEVHNCFDKETGLLVGATMKQHSQMGDIDTESVMSDYRDFDGVKMPTKITVSFGPQQMVTTVRSVTHEAIPDSVFDLPAEVKALQH